MQTLNFLIYCIICMSYGEYVARVFYSFIVTLRRSLPGLYMIINQLPIAFYQNWTKKNYVCCLHFFSGTFVGRSKYEFEQVSV